MKSKDLLVFANEFPYANYETYMETEMVHWKKFEHTYIFSLQLRKKHKKMRRNVPENCTVIPIDFNPAAYIFWTFSVLLDKNFYREMKMLIADHKLSIRSFVQLLVYTARSHYDAHVICQRIRKGKYAFKTPVLYSYRFGYQPYAALLVREKLFPEAPLFCRAHGYDLYEDRKRSNYIPMRRIVLGKITKCFPVSNDGTTYLQNRYPEYSEKIETRYLGTEDAGWTTIERKNQFNLISCSSVSGIKRIHLIIDALALINNARIVWTHFGAGKLMEEMRTRAEHKLPDNIHVEWRGNVDNKKILKEYSTGIYNLFINVSSSEGIPVSIMEAVSAGIPVVATDAGGTREIIQDQFNGRLLPVDTTAREISEAILSFVKMKDDEYKRYSESARSSWEEKFNAEENYRQFMSDIG